MESIKNIKKFLYEYVRNLKRNAVYYKIGVIDEETKKLLNWIDLATDYGKQGQELEAILANEAMREKLHSIAGVEMIDRFIRNPQYRKRWYNYYNNIILPELEAFSWKKLGEYVKKSSH